MLESAASRSFDDTQGRAKARFSVASEKAKEAQKMAAQAFPHPTDPIGGDVGAVRRYVDLLVQAIEVMQKGRDQ